MELATNHRTLQIQFFVSIRICRVTTSCSSRLFRLYSVDSVCNQMLQIDRRKCFLLVPVVELLCALHSVVHLQLLIFYSCDTCCTRH